MALVWKRVAMMTTAFCAAAAYSITQPSGQRATARTASNEFVLDFGDETVRAHVVKHLDSLAHSNLSPLASTCGMASEGYRVFYAAPFDEHFLVSIDVRGNRFEALEYTPSWSEADPRNVKRTEWIVRQRMTDAPAQLAPLRSLLDHMLESGARPVVRMEAMHGAWLIIETCRQGRYHFFERYAPLQTDALIGFMERARTYVRPTGTE